MVKYIECEAAYRFAQDQLKKETGAYSKGWNNALGVMKGALHNNDALPAADVVPVVRCKDCKYSAVDFENMRYCKFVTYYNHVPDDWFCADGERKDGDGE